MNRFTTPTEYDDELRRAIVRSDLETVGDRVDGARFESQAPTATQTRSDISALAGVVNQGVYYGFTGIT